VISRRINQRDYTHYVIVSRDNMPAIETGWSCPEDAKAQIKENLPPGVKAKVISKIGLQRVGLDPDIDDNWLKATDTGFSGVSPRTRQGTRVRFNAHPGSLVLYSRHPEIGEEGSVGTMPGFGKRTYLPGPGGGLLYVNWDDSGMIGVSPNDVEKAKAKQSGLGPAPSYPASGFGKEKTREDLRRRIDWEAWAAAKAREGGHEAVAQGHDMARKAYINEYNLKVDSGLLR
jgi:hypothetical protein